MAKGLPSKLVQPLRQLISRPRNSAASSSIAAAPINLVEKAESTVSAADPILNLDDARVLYSSVSTGKLLRSALNLHAASIDSMVDLGTWFMKSGLMEREPFRTAFLGGIRHTFYEHFCAGENPEEAGRTAARVWGSGLKAMLDYGLEHATDNESCDRNLQGFLQTAEAAESLPQSSASFIVVKITAICPINLLKRVSDLLRWEHNNESFRLPWKRNTLPILSDVSPFYHTQRKPEPLTTEEEEDLDLGHQRLQKLCKKCLEANVPLVIDAEETWVQPAIDYFTYSAALAHNKDDNPIIYGTIQAYLKDAGERLFHVTKAADKMRVPVGIKLVRGAYLYKEREVASSLGGESPIHNTIEETHACFNDCASLLLEKIANGSGTSLVLATHNTESGEMAAAKARDLGIKRENQNLQFAQLYGMADPLSFALRNAGFQVSKYMPFGPVDKVIPYLVRRAEENKGFLSRATLDRQLLRMELKRRLIDGLLSI